ncbi:NADP-specific glutamate dehydrogenase [Toxoplasma gondii TgCatPRC2]|uniref:glutamate dehydrogenase (NADP(+)) n=11 Tax=Toxoplasma gondii TaxID=5811 RepID=A0A125YZM5_TOXGV|nr:NADP-specific glutamate dehydrogenase [Toxoplasma gondii ME49]EPR57668.1 NADP-specific glutamate dehydrogenase [Toxoplasma gondii GT1]ESS29346.1 NADP-specific glutamate dehydrogenase [Toxoplasma gondii VEG]KAF4646060.1 NADP-specific glutamate dehydrogenase [Toxoplasma gondii]KFG35847.1 NADP-specific glutamate dehydrogenase [Toxoplasma gondii p89]KFH14430.1 NADP-specific glutamate dehydrogenase [Toxoplasma gondii MAS]KYF38892.1 NADP-specific glutamate dehydrogenase [Toxoplasma gondii ARI]K|eukprot:XP_002370120.2 NADP-specific glutamate dehydrogenase [Toxoplasma gondii ME49]
MTIPTYADGSRCHGPQRGTVLSRRRSSEIRREQKQHTVLHTFVPSGDTAYFKSCGCIFNTPRLGHPHNWLVTCLVFRFLCYLVVAFSAKMITDKNLSVVTPPELVTDDPGDMPDCKISPRCQSEASEVADPEEVDAFVKQIETANRFQPEFLQAFHEVFDSVRPVLCSNPKYLRAFKVIVEPERCITFRVPWVDDQGKQHVSRGYRVQYSSAAGPYKGGLRFHPSVTLSVMKFLGFEQIFKNSLTGLSIGGAKGGSDFDPKGRSDNEVMRFCQAFMTELSRYIGPNRDVPAGDIGVGAREIGYLFGQYKLLKAGQFEGALTGKDKNWGGSAMRPEATGYGCVYFVLELLKAQNKEGIKGMRCAISGSGNVALYAGEKLATLGAKVMTFSDSSGYIVNEKGFPLGQIQRLKEMKETRSSTRVSEFAAKYSTVKFVPDKRAWEVPCDIAFPCATQNEISEEDAQLLIDNGCRIVAEGANMPTTRDAIRLFKQHGVILCPGKAANAGGVAVSGLEMSQNAMRIEWTREVVDEKLRQIMASIFSKCRSYAAKFGENEFDLVTGANVAGFVKVADCVIDQGYI